MQAKMESQSSHHKDDVVSCLAYTAGLCVTREFVTELLKELMTEGLSPHQPQHHHESDCQHMQDNEYNNECSSSSLPLEGTPSEMVEETVKLEVNEDSVMEEDTKIVADDDNLRRVGRASPHRRHCYYLSKNVPPTYALCMRGVKCKVCGNIFKGMTCVEDLSNHIKKVHRKIATASFLKKIRDENTVENIIGSDQWHDDHFSLKTEYQLRMMHLVFLLFWSVNDSSECDLSMLADASKWRLSNVYLRVEEGYLLT
ncbi:tRNA-specific 2-thiouridylase [Frankliniella fusca]|uniref:tRNA-specific 2-thiouridylase n=1 Tax=Frankliniella fusca TaxID=407009 RepID=A0AAE1GQN0_9NEOP|nr:tRNA-specific 2-thiouridylase [Frankliniella fusca]